MDEFNASENPGLPPDVMDAIGKNRKIEAIKRLRKDRGIDLKEAKEIVDSYIEAQPPRPSNPSDNADSGVGRLIVIGALLVAAYMAYRLLA